jgi:hypothetical protein
MEKFDSDAPFEMAVHPLREPDTPHAAMANLFDNLVRADGLTNAGTRRGRSRNEPHTFWSRSTKKLAASILVGGDEGFDFGAESGIAVASGVEELCPPLRRQPERVFQQLLGSFPSFGAHRRRASILPRIGRLSRETADDNYGSFAYSALASFRMGMSLRIKNFRRSGGSRDDTPLTDRLVGNSIFLQVHSFLGGLEFHAEWLRDEP